METLCGKIGYLNSCSCGIYSKPCCPIRLQHQLLQINLKTTFRNSQIHRLTSPVAKFWKEDSLCKDTRPNALIDNLIQGVRTTLCAVTAAALMCSSTAYAEPLTVAFPASKAREVNRVQKTLVEAWGVIRETFVDPTFNHQDWDMKLEQTMNEMLPLKTADAAYSKISNMLATLGDPFTRLINPKELVRLTYEHPLFWKYYTFASYHEDWLVTKLGKLSKETNPDRMIAIDCEMVRCEDGTEEVVQVCVVDRNLETLIDTLVKPSKPVADYLTPITGVKAEDLEGVTCSLRDMQKTLKKILIPGTIVVGHSLYHDLKVLRIDHARVIDTAFIFQYRNKPITYTPSLRKLSKVVLGHDFREEGKPHICLDDAIFAMKVTLAKLDRRLNDALDMDSVDVSEADASKLYIHNIPHNVFVEELQTLFPEKYAVEIQEFSNKKYRRHTTFAIFKDPKEADEAFESLKGELEMDWNGLPQKAVSFYKAMTVHVRKMKAVNIDTTDSKMSNYNDNVAPFTMKRANKSMDTVAHMATDEEALQHGKRRKAKEMIEPMTNCMKECNDCIHLKEQERLMKELEEKDAEIRNLQKLVSALTRNHCL